MTLRKRDVIFEPWTQTVQMSPPSAPMCPRITSSASKRTPNCSKQNGVSEMLRVCQKSDMSWNLETEKSGHKSCTTMLGSCSPLAALSESSLLQDGTIGTRSFRASNGHGSTDFGSSDRSLIWVFASKRLMIRLAWHQSHQVQQICA